MNEFKRFAEERMREAAANPTQLQAKINEIFDFAAANEALMDAEANAHLDNLTKVLANIFELGVANQPDSPDKRKMLRAIAGVRKEHHQAKVFLKRLSMPLPVPLPTAELARPIFIEVHQSILDLLWDTTRHSQTGIAQFATLGLLYWVFDELTVAFYLAERKYTTQAYAHLRTVYDLLDKAELFFFQPQWAEVWKSDDNKAILKELSPGAVRKKLGRPKFDPTYNLFSELGMHGTSGALRKRVTHKGDPKKIAMRIGGTPFDSEVKATVAACIFAGLYTLLTIAKIYMSRLNRNEVISILEARTTTATEFIQEHFIKPSTNSVEALALTGTLNAITATLKTL